MSSYRRRSVAGWRGTVRPSWSTPVTVGVPSTRLRLDPGPGSAREGRRRFLAGVLWFVMGPGKPVVLPSACCLGSSSHWVVREVTGAGVRASRVRGRGRRRGRRTSTRLRWLDGHRSFVPSRRTLGTVSFLYETTCRVPTSPGRRVRTSPAPYPEVTGGVSAPEGHADPGTGRALQERGTAGASSVTGKVGERKFYPLV